MSWLCTSVRATSVCRGAQTSAASLGFVVVGGEEAVVGWAELAEVPRMPWLVSVRDSVSFDTAPSSASRTGTAAGPAAALPWMRLCSTSRGRGCLGIPGREEDVVCSELAQVP